MDLSIIIVNYRGWKQLRDCLDCLSAYNGAQFDTEVIIVDNDSSDGKIEQFQSDYPKFIFIKNVRNGGFANGCNLGRTHAKADWLLFLNPDTVAPEGEVWKLLNRARENPSVYITSCRQINEKGTESKAFGLFPEFGTLTGTGRAFYRLLNSARINERIRENAYLIKPDWVSGSVIMMNCERFDLIGGFDEDFWMYYEDTDLCRRARNIGGEIAYYTDISIQHNHGGSSRINLKTASLTKTEVLISRHMYISKHSFGAARILIQSWLILNNLVSLIIMGLAGLIFFFLPKIYVKFHISMRMFSYYIIAMKRRSWVSPRSVHFAEND
jgi:GT2 family glycosyltransferase